MKAKRLFKIAVLTTVFGMSYLGVRITSDAESVAGEQIIGHSLSVSQATAICPDPERGSPWGGICNGFERCQPIEAGADWWSANCRP